MSQDNINLVGNNGALSDNQSDSNILRGRNTKKKSTSKHHPQKNHLGNQIRIKDPQDLSPFSIRPDASQSNFNLKRYWSNAFTTVCCRTKPGFNGYSLKTNQDSFVADKSFLDNQNNAFFSVFDGHGQQGHKVSIFLKKTIVPVIMAILQKKTNEMNFQQDNDDHITKQLVEAFVETNAQLNRKLNMVTDLSGSTGVSVLQLNNKFYCANVGDSCAGLLTMKDNGWDMVMLSNEHKPTLPEEKARITAAGGRIEPFKCIILPKPKKISA